MRFGVRLWQLYHDPTLAGIEEKGGVIRWVITKDQAEAARDLQRKLVKQKDKDSGSTCVTHVVKIAHSVGLIQITDEKRAYKLYELLKRTFGSKFAPPGPGFQTGSGR